MAGVRQDYKYKCLVLLMCVVIACHKVDSWGSRLESTGHISPWIKMQSQDNDLSYKTWKHDLNDLPVHVDVQVRPDTGTDTGYYFPGIGSAQRDDFVNSPYGGIIYQYNKDFVMMHAPNKHVGYPAGYSIYTGGSVWNGPKQQTESKVWTRVRVWGEQHLPKPDFFTSWQKIDVNHRPMEIPHGFGVTPQYVVLQIKFGTTENVIEGIGYFMLLESRKTAETLSGVLYCYNDTSIQLFVHYQQGNLFTITNGWGGNNTTSYKEGLFRVLAWKSLHERHRESITLQVPTKQNEISVSSGIDQDCDIVQVMVRVNVSNREYLFKATGAVQNILLNNSFGGVVYSYSTSSIRVWYPPVQTGSQQYFVYIDKFYGGGLTSRATSAILEMTTFKPYGSCLTESTRTAVSTTTITTGKHNMEATKNSCQFEFWIWILVGFGGCLILVLLSGMCWYCMKGKARLKVTDKHGENNKQPTSVITQRPAN